MLTMSTQYTVLSKIMEGFQLLYRCQSCFRNILQKWFFMNFAWNKNNDAIVETLCPYCESKVYVLEKESTDYELLFTTDQIPLNTVTLVITGTAGKEMSIIWGDNTLDYHTFSGGVEYITHDYSTTGNYNIEFYVNPLYVTRFSLVSDHLTGNVPNFNQFTNLLYFYINNNSLTGTLPPLTGLSSLLYFRVYSNNLSGTLPSLASLTSCIEIFINSNDFTGALPSLTGLNSLVSFYLYSNSFSGSFPSIASLSSLQYLYGYLNSFTGSLPDPSLCTNLKKYYLQLNSFSGAIPSFSSNTSITNIRLYSNSLSSYSGSVISLTCVEFFAYSNALDQASVDLILSDFNTNLISRPGSGTIRLEGGTNASPSAAGLIHKANIIAHGWSVTTN